MSGRQIIDFLENEIVSRGLQPGVALPSSRELALRFNVSARTADRALGRLAKTGLIVREVGRGNFVKNNRVRAERLKVALCVWNHHRYGDESLPMTAAAFNYFDDCLVTALKNYGYDTTVFQTNAASSEAVEMLHHKLLKYDALLAPMGILERNREFFRHAPVPVILLGEKVEAGNWHQAVFDFRPGFRKALELTVKKHFTDYVLIADTDGTGLSRASACLEMARELGIAESRFQILPGKKAESGLSPQLLGYMAAEEIVARQWLKRAILSTSDFYTCGMLEFFKKSGLRKGVDYHLISYDNTESRIATPEERMGITAITHPLEAMVEALLMLLEYATRKTADRNFYLACLVPADELVIRHSLTVN